MKANIKQKLITIFWKQNSWHRHGVLIHTIKVTWWIIKDMNFRMFAAWLLHDIWKPSASKRDETKELSYSFNWHEKKSYKIIKNWKIISDYTKNLVRWHYLIRGKKKAKEKSNDPKKTKKERKYWKNHYLEQKKVWKNLDKKFKKDLKIFLIYDDYWK
jgi:hypothetical protein